MFSQAVRMGKWKAYIEEGKWELFNLDADPYEKDNIVNQHPDIVEKIKTVISKHKERRYKEYDCGFVYNSLRNMAKALKVNLTRQ
jgi:hypothetical protein